MSIKKLLSQNAFWQVNKAMAKLIGVDAALILSDLIAREEYFKSKNMLVSINGNGYFFVTSDDIENTTTYSYHIQKKCIKVLKEHGMIETFLRGIPAKTHYMVVESKVEECFKSSSEKINKLKDLNQSIEIIKEPVIKKIKNCDVKDLRTINKNKNKNTNKNNNNIESVPKENKNSHSLSNELILVEDIKPKKIIKENKPSDLLEVEIYFKEKAYDMNEAESFFEYYENIGWKVGRNPMKKWKYAANKWIKNARPKYGTKSEPVSLAKKYFPEMFGLEGQEVKALDLNKVFGGKD